ncbi:Spermidine synthase [Enhygromyxa salina]|uniref:Polyamine aminopropyltransferase n=1 Tax=Enhygromyxa salina TaxID=215803 RepID=A0A0C2DBR1_9BACT|nr:Spermidine synthase [Enhygromyxa salina]
MLFSQRSPFQDIVLAQEPSGHINLTLDDVWQFRSQDEHVFHEVLADTPIMMAASPASVLILGGGDGLALRNVLRYPAVRQVTLCELDPCVLTMTRTVPELVALSENSLADPRAQVIAADALAFVETADVRYDVVICDFPAVTSPELSRLFAPAFFRQLAAITHAHSVVSIQVSLDPAGFWPICAAVEASFAWLHPMLANLDAAADVDGGDDDNWADFVIASQTPQVLRTKPAAELRFLSHARVPRLRIKNRAGDRFETDEYGQMPDYR